MQFFMTASCFASLYCDMVAIFSWLIILIELHFLVAQRSWSVRSFVSPAPVKQPHAATPYKRPAAAPSPRRRLSSAYWHETVDCSGVSHLDKTQLERQEVRTKNRRRMRGL
jgi:hypothetical protein